MAGETFILLNGLKALGRRLRGDEVVHVGIRPFGFHAGNVLSLIAYPYLLFEELELGGRQARFTLVVSINDWEQYKPAGPSPARFPYNIRPESRTIQYTLCETTGQTLVDRWQPVIERGFAPLRARFPKVRIQFIRNSELKLTQPFRTLVPRTMELGPEIGALLDRYSRFPVLASPSPTYVGAVCPICTWAVGDTLALSRDAVRISCANCDSGTEGRYEEFEYWWHHKPMFIGRWAYLGVDVAISGADHFEDGDADVRHRLRRLFGLPERPLSMLFTPKVLDADGHKMSKTLNNEAAVDPQAMIAFARQFPGHEFRVSAEFDEMVPSRIVP